jgi:hypothetical protein
MPGKLDIGKMTKKQLLARLKKMEKASSKTAKPTKAKAVGKVPAAVQKALDNKNEQYGRKKYLSVKATRLSTLFVLTHKAKKEYGGHLVKKVFEFNADKGTLGRTKKAKAYKVVGTGIKRRY